MCSPVLDKDRAEEDISGRPPWAVFPNVNTHERVKDFDTFLKFWVVCGREETERNSEMCEEIWKKLEEMKCVTDSQQILRARLRKIVNAEVKHGKQMQASWAAVAAEPEPEEPKEETTDEYRSSKKVVLRKGKKAQSFEP